LFEDRRFTIPRNWSNKELKKFSYLFNGDVINVSGWRDKDKEGNDYKDYFKNARSYTISNFESKKRGFQGKENEFFLDLSEDLPQNLINKYDVVFNHTVLEHIFDFKKAFKNLCLLSKDVVILVVPFIQEMHGEYGDFWRFTPEAIKILFKKNKMKVLYSCFNTNKLSSVYLFFVATKTSGKWEKKIHRKYSHKYFERYLFLKKEKYVGASSIKNNLLIRTNFLLKKVLKIVKKLTKSK